MDQSSFFSSFFFLFFLISVSCTFGFNQRITGLIKWTNRRTNGTGDDSCRKREERIVVRSCFWSTIGGGRRTSLKLTLFPGFPRAPFSPGRPGGPVGPSSPFSPWGPACRAYKMKHGARTPRWLARAFRSQHARGLSCESARGRATRGISGISGGVLGRSSQVSERQRWRFYFYFFRRIA